MKTIILLLTISYLSLLSANDTSSEPRSSEDNGIYLRVGGVLSDGSAKLRQTDYSTISPLSNTQVVGAIGNAFDFTLGYEKSNYNVRFFVNVKMAYDDIGEYELKSTRTGVGLEGYTAFKSINFNYGCSIAGGGSDFTMVKDSDFAETAKFLGIEPYIGLDGLIVGSLGYYARLAYEVKGYDEFRRTTTIGGSTEDVADAFVVHLVNLGFGFSYKF